MKVWALSDQQYVELQDAIEKRRQRELIEKLMVKFLSDGGVVDVRDNKGQSLPFTSLMNRAQKKAAGIK